MSEYSEYIDNIVKLLDRRALTVKEREALAQYMAKLHAEGEQAKNNLAMILNITKGIEMP